jgi:hypothetical protein
MANYTYKFVCFTKFDDYGSKEAYLDELGSSGYEFKCCFPAFDDKNNQKTMMLFGK